MEKSEKFASGVKMNKSECCDAKVYDDTDICSKCLEHCRILEDS